VHVISHVIKGFPWVGRGAVFPTISSAPQGPGGLVAPGRVGKDAGNGVRLSERRPSFVWPGRHL